MNQQEFKQLTTEVANQLNLPIEFKPDGRAIVGNNEFELHTGNLLRRCRYHVLSRDAETIADSIRLEQADRKVDGCSCRNCN